MSFGIDHSPDNVTFPDISVTVRGTPPRHLIGMLSVTHIMPVLVLLSVVGVGMQQCIIRNLIFKTQQILYLYGVTQICSLQ